MKLTNDIILIGSETVIQIMHQAVREFLLDQNTPITRSKFKEIIKADAQAWIAEICIHYKAISTTHIYAGDSCVYNYKSIQILGPWDNRLLESYTAYLNDRPLVGYVARYLKSQKVASNDDLEKLSPILTRFNNQQNGDSNKVRELAIQVNHDVFKEREQQWRLNDARDQFLNRYLWYSAHVGFYDAARILLSVGALVNTGSKNCQYLSTYELPIPASLSAAKNAHVRVVQLSQSQC